MAGKELQLRAGQRWQHSVWRGTSEHALRVWNVLGGRRLGTIREWGANLDCGVTSQDFQACSQVTLQSEAKLDVVFRKSETHWFKY